LPVDELKIDRSFVQSLESDAEFATVLRSAIDMGHGLGLKVVAEGVETSSAASRLREFGCDIAQGYFYAKTMPQDAFASWMQGKPRVPIIAITVAFSVDDVTDTVSLGTF
jgi:EAL domain-containing protein (putative c-di-GMP-specific phosphodiesterase class I)